MYAIVRQYVYEPGSLLRTREALAQVQVLHAAQPGYVGSLVVDDGQRLTAVNLWRSEADAAAGRAAIGPSVQRLLDPLMAGGSQLLSAGGVMASDLEGVRANPPPDEPPEAVDHGR